MTLGPRPDRRVVAGVALRCAGVLVALLLAGVAAGCAASRNSLGTGDSACFQAIPVADQAVHHEGKFIGVHRVPTEHLRHRLPEVPHHPHKDVCVVAFRGNFHSDQVAKAPLGQSGHYAVVVVSSPGNHLVKSLVLTKLPLSFRHL
jgi:hypothetical protein